MYRKFFKIFYPSPLKEPCCRLGGSAANGPRTRHSQMSGSILCTVIRWRLRFSFLVNLRSQRSHENIGRTPHSSFKCFLRLLRRCGPLYWRPQRFGHSTGSGAFWGASIATRPPPVKTHDGKKIISFVSARIGL